MGTDRDKHIRKNITAVAQKFSAAENHIWEMVIAVPVDMDVIIPEEQRTCTEKAICISLITYRMVEVDADHHTGWKTGYRQQQPMRRKYDCCGKVTVAKEKSQMERWRL